MSPVQSVSQKSLGIVVSKDLQVSEFLSKFCSYVSPLNHLPIFKDFTEIKTGRWVTISCQTLRKALSKLSALTIPPKYLERLVTRVYLEHFSLSVQLSGIRGK